MTVDDDDDDDDDDMTTNSDQWFEHRCLSSLSSMVDYVRLKPMSQTTQVGRE
ncbi:hypothetical protein G9A89_010689 [Geosiphon pyriformis]|nr:hypothetical protein G9A89_010689 [Geosiphon pyriformis]